MVRPDMEKALVPGVMVFMLTVTSLKIARTVVLNLVDDGDVPKKKPRLEIPKSTLVFVLQSGQLSIYSVNTSAHDD